jgi:Subtilase family
MNRCIKLALSIAVCALGTACNTLTIQPTRAINAMDTTMGTYREADSSRYIIVTMADTVFDQLVQGERVDREAELPPLYARFVGNLSRTYSMKRVADWPLNTLGIRCLVFEVPDPSKRDGIIAALAKERFVESAQRLSTYYTSGASKPNDSKANDGPYNDPYRNLQPSLQLMQVAESHRWATGQGVRVAVIDTGVDTRHQELRDRVAGIRNFVDRDLNQFSADVHGTAVAGVIAAAANNGVGFVGIAPQAQVLGLKACWQLDTVTGKANCSSFTLAKAINFAIDQQVDIINLSLGGPPDPLLERLVAKAMEKNILVVGAVNPAYLSGFPAGVDGVIAASDGAVQAGGAAEARFVSAPGNQVLSTRPNNEYDFFTGTSFSAANVTGLSALIRQRKPHLSNRLVKDLLMATAQKDQGTVNACQAIARIVADGSCDAAAPVQATNH